METLLQDMRYGARMLLKHKGSTAIAVLSLALGIGAHTALFSLADAFLWRALPGVDNDRLFTLVRGDGMIWPSSYPDYIVYRDRSKSLAGLAAYDPVTLAFGKRERSRLVMGELVTGNFFEVWRVFGFALMLSVLTSLIFGLAPAWAATKPDVVSALKDEPGMSGRRKWFSLRNSLVVAQIATSLTLLVGAGLSTRSLRNIQNMDLGFDTGNGLVMTLDLGRLKYDKERGLQFYTQFIERLATTPGVRSITIANHLPLDTGWGFTNISIEGQPPVADGRPMNAVRQNIGLRYFGTMGIPLLRGRDFTAQDTASSEPVVIINETMARRHWPKLKDIGEVIGQRIRIGSDQDAKLTTIIGVAVDTNTYWLIGEKREGMWTPISQNFSPSFQALVRTNAEETSTVPSLRREVAALDPNLPIKIITLREHIRSQTRAAEMFAGLLTSLGGLGLLLTAIGLYGVMSYAVAQRTREIGIRMSLGARAPDVLKMIIRHGMRLTLAGLAIGLVAALAIMRVVRSLFYEVSAHDPITFVVVPLALSAVALLACYVPARRATKADPLAALRHE